MKRLALFTFVVSWALTTTLLAQTTLPSIRLQSESYQVLKRTESGDTFEALYVPKGDDENSWKSMVVISKFKSSDKITDLALIEAKSVQGRGGKLNGALVMEARSKKSVYVDIIQQKPGFIESSISRYFESKDGIYMYRWVSRMNTERLPANDGMAEIELMKFVERSRLKRPDIIIDLSKAGLPFQSPDDPMGLKKLPLK